MAQIPTDGFVTIRVKAADAGWLERIGKHLDATNKHAPGSRMTRSVVVGKLLRMMAEHERYVADAERDPSADPPPSPAAIAPQDAKAHRDASIDAAQITKTASDAEREIARVAAETAAQPAKPPARKARR